MGRPDRGLRLIALFKFSKATLLIALGLGALQLLNPETTAGVRRWTAALATSSDRHLLQQLVARVAGLSPHGLEVLALGGFLYAALFTTEGIGLWLGERWAEYLTAVATASFVPIEIYELVQRFTALRVTALGLNVAVAAYLIYRLRRRPAQETSAPGWPVPTGARAS